MDASTLITPLIGLVAPIVVSAIRRPASRIEERTSRLQYWKTFFEVAPLAGASVTEETKQLCRAEMAEGEDETKNIGNKLVTHITTAYTVVVMFFVSLILSRATTTTTDMMVWQYQHQNPPQVTPQQFRDVTQQVGYAWLILQALVMCLIWFWARWRIRNFVWDKLRAGKTFHFLLSAGPRMKALTKVAVLFLVALSYWVSIVLVYQVLPLPKFPHSPVP